AATSATISYHWLADKDTSVGTDAVLSAERYNIFLSAPISRQLHQLPSATIGWQIKIRA
ncbi:hypothetical protein J6590_084159, partial [Homalodisca vitripennis]